MVRSSQGIKWHPLLQARLKTIRLKTIRLKVVLGVINTFEVVSGVVKTFDKIWSFKKVNVSSIYRPVAN